MRVLFASIALAAAGLSTAASAQSFDQPVTATVSFADLNLDSAAGRATLQGRIKVAANRICQNLAVTPLEEVNADSKCRVVMTSSAERQLEIAVVSSPRDTLLASR